MLCVMCEHTMSFMMPSIIIFYLESIEPTWDLAQISYKIGVLEGAFGICALAGGLFWGFVSDKIGRKATLSIILTGMGLSSIGFGISTSFELALFWRILAGLYSGVIPLTKALMRDVSDDSTISILYSYFGAGYGAGSMVGPFFGGLLSKPNQSLPDYLQIGFLDDFPYFLPFLFQYYLNSTFIVISTLLLITISVKSRPIHPETHSKSYSFLCNKNYVFSVLALFLTIFLQYCYRTLLSLWLKLDRSQEGMGFDSVKNTGYLNSLSGIICMIFPLLATNKLKNCFGLRYTCIFLCLMLFFPMSLISFGNTLEGHWAWLHLIVCNGFVVGFCTVFLSIISIAVSNSVSGSVAGTAIGLSQSIVSFSRGLSTSGTAVVFGYIKQNSDTTSFKPHYLFYLNNLFSLLIIATIFLLVDKRVESRESLRKS